MLKRAEWGMRMSLTLTADRRRCCCCLPAWLAGSRSVATVSTARAERAVQCGAAIPFGFDVAPCGLVQ